MLVALSKKLLFREFHMGHIREQLENELHSQSTTIYLAFSVYCTVPLCVHALQYIHVPNSSC